MLAGLLYRRQAAARLRAATCMGTILDPGYWPRHVCITTSGGLPLRGARATQTSGHLVVIWFRVHYDACLRAFEAHPRKRPYYQTLWHTTQGNWFFSFPTDVYQCAFPRQRKLVDIWS